MGYREEGTFGPGGKKAVAIGAAVIVLVAAGWLVARGEFGEIDLESFVDVPELETDAGPPLPELPIQPVPELGADNPDPLTGPGFATVLHALRDEVGPEAPLLRASVTLGGAEFHLRDGENAYGYTYSPLVGELQPVRVRVIGAGSLRDEDFPLSDVPAEAVGRILRGLRHETGDRKVELISAVLDPIPVLGEERWVITADTDDRSGLVFEAEIDGRDVKPFGDQAGGTPTPTIPEPVIPDDAQQALDDAQKIFDCIQSANGDVNKIQECVPTP